MKRLAVLAVALSSVAAQAVVIYDGIGVSTTFTSTTGGLPRNRMADGIDALSGAGPWNVTAIDVGI